ncbi:MAG: hypothetical protein CVT90_00800 [Candidatus Altiarchaeales archaeon HGW-Altiarchaeales-3]|nr:MAG: hypothetical protein CVT90_00800 [Candidatus Altiarchaeales archaeon HGW-Altiarchaeales-3]
MKTKTNITLYSYAILISTILVFNFSLTAEGTILYERGTQNYSYNFPEPIIKSLGIYDTIILPGTYPRADIGSPTIPVKTAKILLPADSKIKNIKVTGYHRTSINGSYYLKPYQGVVKISEPALNYTNNQAVNVTIYNSENEFPKNLYSIESIQNFRGYKILLLNLYPVHYTPKTGKINYYKNLNVEIETEKQHYAAKKISNKFRNRIEDKKELLNLIDNPEIADTYAVPVYLQSPQILTLSVPEQNESYDYVIITNNALNNSTENWTFQNLSDWKTQKGIKTKIVTIELIINDHDYWCDGLWGDGCGNPGFNDTQSRIRNFIKDAYQTWGIRYVLLGGDDEIIPHRGFYCHIEGMFLPPGEETDTDIPSDMYYGCLDGSFNYNNNSYYGEVGDGDAGGENDLFCEVYIGRAPVSNTREVSYFVMKTISYENSNDSYLSKALFAGENLQADHWGKEAMDEIKDGSNNWGLYNPPFPSCFNTETLYDKDTSWDKNTIINKINDNFHIINHLGHASFWIDMKMLTSDADALTNIKYFFGYSQGCVAGAFDCPGTIEGVGSCSGDAIIEHFVVKNPTGAFAFIGNSRYGLADEEGTTNAPSQFYQRKFYDAVFGQKITNIGRANHYSKESLAGMINSHTGGMRWVYYELNLLGDPETPLHINCSAFNPPAECKNLTVCKNGSCDYARIDDAAGAVCRGYAVTVMDNETYNGTVSLFGNNITLNCNGAKLVGSGSGTGITVLSSDNALVKNCMVENYTYGISLLYSAYVNLHNNSMQNNTYNFDVEGSEISHYAHNISTSNRINNKLMYYLVGEQDEKLSEDCAFAGVVSCKNITISNTTLTNNGYGAIIINSSDIKVVNNTIRNHEHSGILLKNSSLINISHNNITSNTNNGITLGESKHCELFNNSIRDNSARGISMENSSLINISHNTISESFNGIYMFGSSKNRIFNNDMSSNTNNGIILVESQENELFNNSITRNFDGIWVYKSSNNNFINDNFLSYNKMRGIGIENLSVNNSIADNIIKNNRDIGIWILTNDSKNNTLNFNTICGNPVDINDTDNNSGNDNFCDVAYNWNDTGAVGCKQVCSEEYDIAVEVVLHYPLNPVNNSVLHINAVVVSLGNINKNSDEVNVSLFIDDIYQNSVIVNLTGKFVVDVEINWTAVFGEHNITIIADPGELINETCETNNELSMKLWVYHECDLNFDGIIYQDWDDLMRSYKCFLGIGKNCDKISFQDWEGIRREYECFFN